MQCCAAALILFFTVAGAAAGDDGYQFRVSMTTVAGGLHALKPDHPSLRSAPAHRLEAPALLFEKRSRRGWRLTFASCGDGLPMSGCEIRINEQAQSSAPRDAALDPLERQIFDLGFSANDDGTVRLRCLRRTCCIVAVTPEKPLPQIVLQFGESKDLPFESEIDATFLH